MNVLDLMAPWNSDDQSLLTTPACTKVTRKLRQSIFVCPKARGPTFENTIEKLLDFKFPKFQYNPEIEAKRVTGFGGLKNLCGTCYANAVLQQLSTIPEFTELVLAVGAGAHPRQIT
jgi:ubiquitin C-terminal hydrolase